MAKAVQKESKIVYLQIGQNYENLGVQKQFDVSEWVEEFPNAHIYLLFKRPGEEAAAPVNTELDENGILTWTVSNWETGIIGVGFAEIRAIDTETGLVKKSHVIPCSVEASITDEDTHPDYPSWVDRMITMNEHLESVYDDFDEELTEGVAAIQQEAATQKQTAVDAIQAKGETVIASIPSSYTDLIEALAGYTYNPNRHYDHGEFCWYDDKLWRRREDSAAIVGSWVEADWIEAPLTSFMAELGWDVENLTDTVYNSVAPQWDYYDTTASYAVGDYVIHRYNLYRCISAVSGGGDFDYNKWEHVSVAEELQKYIQSGVIASNYSASSTYKVGDHVWYSGSMYRCNADIDTAEAWTAAHWTLVKVGEELTALKSAFSEEINGTNGLYFMGKPFVISSSNKWTQSSQSHVSIPVSAGDTVNILQNTEYPGVYAFLKSDNAASGVAADFATGETGRYVLSEGESSGDKIVPSDCTILYLTSNGLNNSRNLPEKIVINGVDIAYNVRKQIDKITSDVEGIQGAIDTIEIKQEAIPHKAWKKNLDIWGMRGEYGRMFSPVDFSSVSFLAGFDLPVFFDGYKIVHSVDLSKYKNVSANTFTVSTQVELETAISEAVSGDTIIINDGVYEPIVLTKSVNLIGNGKPVFVTDDVGTFDTTGSDVVFRTVNSFSDAITDVYDASRIDEGIIIPMAKKNSVSGVVNNPGSWTISSSSDNQIYVHLFDGRIATNRNVIICDKTKIPIKCIQPTENATIYMENITVVGGDSNLLYNDYGSYNTQKLIAKGCRFYFGRTHNNVSLYGVNGFFQNCEASFSHKDGFNYHKNVNSEYPGGSGPNTGTIANGFEIDCIGHDNGFDDTAASPSDNGSTMHNGGTAVRINGVYYRNKGGNVADTSANTVTYNYCCYAFDSVAPKNTNCADFWADNNATMHLYGCRASGNSQYNLWIDRGATIDVNNCEYETAYGMSDNVDSLKKDVIDLKSAVDYTSDIIEYSGRRYIDFEQGTISSTGAEVDHASWVRTGFIPIETILAVKKPLGFQMGHFYYDGNKAFIESASSAQTISDEKSYEVIRAAHPTAKYVRYRLRMYDGTTAITTTPDKILESDFNIIITSASNGFFSIENQILTKSMAIYVPVSCESSKNMIIEIRSKYTGTQPTLQAIRSWEGSDGAMHQYYNSALFPVGGENYITQRIRIAPSPITSGITKLSITVPTESTLDVLYVRNSYSDMRYMSDFGINLNGHGKYGCGAPDNVCASYELASKMGYKYCITIPKVTSDGVLVCLHDDDSIQATARNDDGSQIASEYRDRAVRTFTYQELLQFDFGIGRGIPFKGERIPLLEDFFKICAKTGMHPMLSCHPSLPGYWADIRALAIKYNLLDKLNIKCDQSNITVMMDALGGDIESYTIDESGGVDRADRMVTLINRYNIDTTKCRCGVEYINTITDEQISSALNAGLFVGFYGYGTNASRVKELIAKGVTEFTDDYIASVGLNW